MKQHLSLPMILVILSIRLIHWRKQSLAGHINHCIDLPRFKVGAHVQECVDGGGHQLGLRGWVHPYIESSDVG